MKARRCGRPVSGSGGWLPLPRKAARLFQVPGTSFSPPPGPGPSALPRRHPPTLRAKRQSNQPLWGRQHALLAELQPE